MLMFQKPECVASKSLAQSMGWLWIYVCLLRSETYKGAAVVDASRGMKYVQMVCKGRVGVTHCMSVVSHLSFPTSS